MNFKTWLENNENTDLFQNLEPSSTHEKNSESLKTKFAEFKKLYEIAINSEHITKDQYKKLKDTFEDSTHHLSQDIFNEFARNYGQQQSQKIQQKQKELNDQGISYDLNTLYRITDPFHLFINELLFANQSQKFKLLDKKPNQKFIDALPENIKQTVMEMKIYAANYLETKKKIDELKSKVKSPAELKTIKKTKEDEEKQKIQFNRPLASKIAVQKLETIIEQLLQEKKQEFLKNYKEHLLQISEFYYNKFKNSPDLDMQKVRNTLMSYSIEKLFTLDRKNNNIEKIENLDQIADNLTNEKWNEMSTFFKSRMIDKISPIVDKKGETNNDFNMNVINISTNHGTLEGIFSFTFSDKSSFVVTHQVVGHMSKNNIPFYRFPTHFKNIKTADGTSYNALPEREMYPKFANIQPPKEID